MRENHEAFTSVSRYTTLLNKTGTWRTQRPVFEKAVSPCGSACLAGNNIPEWLGLVKEGELQKAWEVIMGNNPLIFTCGSVCPHPCEDACNRGQFDDVLSIRDIERFLGEQAIRSNWLPPMIARVKEDKVAIIGSGPAGLSCAYQLARRGYNVTIFEALPLIGGMLRVGIQDYRLPRDMLEREIRNNILLPFKVEVRTNYLMNQEVFQKIRLEFRTIFIATGAHESRELKVPGVDLDGVFYGVNFLRDKALSKLPSGLFQEKKVLIIGGGGVAVDAARSVLRLGANDVKLVCLESREDMPAFEWDIQDAIREGVEIDYSWGPEEILGGNVGKVKGVGLVRCSSVFNSEGKFNPLFDRSIKKSHQIDAVIIAIGQVSNLSFLDEDVQLTPEVKVKIDDTLKTNVANIFAGGDVVTEPATVIEAIAAGSKAAHSIDRYLKGEPLILEKKATKIVDFEELNLDYSRHQPRQDKIVDNTSAMEEAKRCFSCGYCNLCGNCWAFCPDIAINREEPSEIDYDYCKGCGICIEECPTKAMSLKQE